MTQANCRQLLQDILDNKWAAARIEQRIAHIKATDPHFQRLASQKPNLAEAQIVVSLNEEFVGEFANLPVRIIEALITFADETNHLPLQCMHLVEGELNHNAFPIYPGPRKVIRQQRIVTVPPSPKQLSNAAAELFSPHGKIYRLRAIVIEVITFEDSTIDVRLHLSVNNERPNPGTPVQVARYAYLTVDPDGQIYYEQFTVHLRTDVLVQFSAGYLTANDLLAPVSCGRTDKLDTFFRGAKAQLAVDLKLIPEYLQLVSTSMNGNTMLRGF